mmetsp:Transcript_2718/g.10963  ORF Transcript_2718/g.10963 Transcript_2718/m.10963 type:complete len:367 (+) Transcript_2718:677-1777(+)
MSGRTASVSQGKRGFGRLRRPPPPSPSRALRPAPCHRSGPYSASPVLRPRTSATSSRACALLRALRRWLPQTARGRAGGGACRPALQGSDTAAATATLRGGPRQSCAVPAALNRAAAAAAEATPAAGPSLGSRRSLCGARRRSERLWCAGAGSCRRPRGDTGGTSGASSRPLSGGTTVGRWSSPLPAPGRESLQPRPWAAQSRPPVSRHLPRRHRRAAPRCRHGGACHPAGRRRLCTGMGACWALLGRPVRQLSRCGAGPLPAAGVSGPRPCPRLPPSPLRSGASGCGRASKRRSVPQRRRVLASSMAAATAAARCDCAGDQGHAWTLRASGAGPWLQRQPPLWSLLALTARTAWREWPGSPLQAV